MSTMLISPTPVGRPVSAATRRQVLQGAGRLAESIAALAPDAILDGAFGDQQQRYDTLSAIAPTLSYSTADYTNWRDGLRLAGQAFGREQQARDFVAAYEQRAAALRTRVEDRFPNRTAAVFYPGDGGGLTADIASNQTLAAMIDFGFVAATGVVPSDDTAIPFAPERLGDLAGVDAIVLGIDLGFEAGARRRSSAPRPPTTRCGPRRCGRACPRSRPGRCTRCPPSSVSLPAHGDGVAGLRGEHAAGVTPSR